ncbi:MAG: cyanophycinase [Ginsengibacter sp.]
MKTVKYLTFGILMIIAVACKKDLPGNPAENGGQQPPAPPPAMSHPGSLGFLGDTTDVSPTVTGGLVLMGGGSDVSAAFRWMIDKSGGGNAVIIRSTGTNAYNSYVNGLGNLKSVETLLINSRDLANNDQVARVIKNAELLFIAGGDQSDYMNYWRGTKMADAINYLLTTKKAPVGGTSAGCAILGKIYYSGENGSVTSDEALPNPYRSTITLYKNDFLNAPFMNDVITDQHFLTRNRQGRLTVFLARSLQDWNIAAKGIAADEGTAVCVDQNGKAVVYGSSNAYFLKTDISKKPEKCQPGLPLDFINDNKSVMVYQIRGSTVGNGSFSVSDFNAEKASGGVWSWWSVTNGVLNQISF